ncbi:hypothetical protein WG908_04435 [Sphingobium sp. AN641]|uniref:hypothetical protein n=1 Tax=Sphingobium sp. AN641 TaxID=3133443 RepID=UPI0030C385ED
MKRSDYANRLCLSLPDGMGWLGLEFQGYRHELHEIQSEQENSDLLTAQRVSALYAGPIASGQWLLNQLEISGDGKPNLIPGPLLEEALSYDRDVLRKKLARLVEETEPASILAKMRKARAAASGKEKGK